MAMCAMRWVALEGTVGCATLTVGRIQSNHDNHFKRLRTASSGERSNGHAMPLKEDDDDAEDDDLDSQPHSNDERQDEEDELNDEETQEVDEHMQRSIHGGGVSGEFAVAEEHD